MYVLKSINLTESKLEVRAQYVSLTWGRNMSNIISYAWKYIFDHEVSPLRHIPDIATRHMILQILGWMWAVAFSLALGSYTIFAVTVLGHAILIAAAAITVATYTTATIKPEVFTAGWGRRTDGEHD